MLMLTWPSYTWIMFLQVIFFLIKEFAVLNKLALQSCEVILSCCVIQFKKEGGGSDRYSSCNGHCCISSSL